MPIEVESPEEVGYDRIRCNLAESSVTDVRLGDLDVALADLVLLYGDHLGHAGLRALIAADGPGLSAEEVMLTPGAAAALFMIATSLLRSGDHLIVARPNYATNLETPRAIGADISFLDLSWDDAWAVEPARIAALLRPETRLVSLTTPHNPTGQLMDEATLSAVIGLVEAHPHARLLIDETYRELQDGPLPPLAAARSERVIPDARLATKFTSCYPHRSLGARHQRLQPVQGVRPAGHPGGLAGHPGRGAPADAPGGQGADRHHGIGRGRDHRL